MGVELSLLPLAPMLLLPCRSLICWTWVGEPPPPPRIKDFCPQNSYLNEIDVGVELSLLPLAPMLLLPCRSLICWTWVGEHSITGPDLIRGTSEKVDLIQKRLLVAQSRQKNYDSRRRRPLEFEVGDHVFLKVMPKIGVVRFGKQGKLAPRYIGPFKILERVGTVAYWLALPPSLSSVHKVFHVSILRKYTPDLAHVRVYSTRHCSPRRWIPFSGIGPMQVTDPHMGPYMG